MQPKIWLSSPHMGGNERKFINEAFDTNWLAPLGPNVNGLEKDIARFLLPEKENNIPVAAGQYETDGKTFLRFACADGSVSVKELQLEGKKKMMIEEFLRGYHFK